MRFLIKGIFFLFALALLGAVALWLCPAELAYRWYADRLAPVTLTGVSGSIWQGHAARMQVFNSELGTLDWQLEPWPLLRGEKVVHVAIEKTDCGALATLTRHANGQLEIIDTNVHLPANVLDPALNARDLHLLGRIDIHLTRARLRGAWIQSADGDALWRDATVEGAVQTKLSDLRATFATMPDGAIAGELHDLGGALAADGVFNVALGGYSADLKLAARNGDAQVLDALRRIGELQPDGSLVKHIHGKLLKVL